MQYKHHSVGSPFDALRKYYDLLIAVRSCLESHHWLSMAWFMYGLAAHACQTQGNTQSLCGQTAPAHLNATLEERKVLLQLTCAIGSTVVRA